MWGKKQISAFKKPREFQKDESKEIYTKTHNLTVKSKRLGDNLKSSKRKTTC